jgi:hypothetical protein
MANLKQEIDITVEALCSAFNHIEYSAFSEIHSTDCCEWYRQNSRWACRIQTEITGRLIDLENKKLCSFILTESFITRAEIGPRNICNLM